MAYFAQGILKYLATLAVTVSSGLADPAPSLLRVPADVIAEVVDGEEDRHWQAADRKRLLQLLAHDPRESVRSLVAKQAATLWADAPEDALELVRSLSHDGALRVRFSAAAALEQVLAQAPPLEAMGLVAEWVTSAAEAERAAVAFALRGAPATTLTDLAVEVLAADRSDVVRRFAIEAAAARFTESPVVYAQVLSRLTLDPQVAIRFRARQVLEQHRQA